MSGARRLGRTVHRYDDEYEDFDRDAEENSEVTVINVSPFVARFEIATVPGSRSRKVKLDPGKTTMLQRGYAFPFMGASRHMVRPMVESATEREAWPGRRGHDKDNKLVWLKQPGPRLPQVVSEDRADEVRALWDAAMAQRQSLDEAPLRLTLQRDDGLEVPVAVDMPSRKPRVIDEEDQMTGAIEPPPPDHDDPIAPESQEIPAMPVVGAADVQPATPPPTRAEARARKNGGG